MLDDDLIEMMQREVELGYDDSRLRFILNWVKSGRPLFECDRRYLSKRFANYPEEEKQYQPSKQLAETMQNEVNTVQESISDQDGSGFEAQRTSISRFGETGPEAIMRQEKVLVEMRKNLHKILVTLDQLEEKFVKKANQKSTQETIHISAPTTIPDVKQERQVKTEGSIKEKNNERHKKLLKERQDLRRFATVLLLITAITFAIYFSVLALLGISTLKETLGQYGINYDLVKPLLNWLVTALIFFSGTWTIFGFFYLKNSRMDNPIH